MMQAKKTFQQIESKAICEIYNLLKEQGYISFELMEESIKKIEALAASINSLHFGKDIYPTPEEKCVAYLYFIIKNHPFIDGNKRTAALTFAVVCDLNNLKPNYKDTTLDEIVVFIEQSKTDNHQEFIKSLARFIFATDEDWF